MNYPIKNLTDRATWLPAVLLVYLGVMAYVGRPMLDNGEALRYWLSLSFGIAVVIALRWTLVRKRNLEQQRRHNNPDTKDGGGRR